MPTKETREELEKYRLSLKKHISSIEASKKELRRKQFVLERLSDRLREQELRLAERINQELKIQNPFLQNIFIEVKKGEEINIILYLN